MEKLVRFTIGLLTTVISVLAFVVVAPIAFIVSLTD